jgi:hypothetical protein
MNHASGNKSVTKAAASVAASATHSHEIDCAGFKYATIDVVYSPFTAATSAYASVLKVQDSDTSGSGQADVSGLSITAGAGSTTGANVGAVARFNIDLRGRKRYLTVVTSPGNTVAIVTNARLSKGEQHAVTASEAGVNNVASV